MSSSSDSNSKSLPNNHPIGLLDSGPLANERPIGLLGSGPLANERPIGLLDSGSLANERPIGLLDSGSLANERPIGLFDSGVGGLTLFRELLSLLPQEYLIYLGDQGNFPYGNQPPEKICRYALKNSAFLLNKKIKLLVVACQTASALALEMLEQKLSIPVIGISRFGVSELLQATKTQQVAILGTSNTVSSQVHAKQIASLSSTIRVHSVACPLFAPLVEEGLAEHPIAEQIARHYLSSLQPYPIDTLLLGCTHYPLLQSAIQKTVGSQVTLIEPAHLCAREVLTFLTKQKLLRTGPARYEFYTTGPAEKFEKLASFFLRRRKLLEEKEKLNKYFVVHGRIEI